jgi:hypothetical protein
MKSFFDAPTQLELLRRLDALVPEAPARWGRMAAPQMLAHCHEGLRMGQGDLKIGWTFPALFGWTLKRLAYDDRPFPEGAPTARELKVGDPRDFELEKARLLAQFIKVGTKPSAIVQHRHPFFGKLTGDQWGMLMFKHLDHHFRQFGI